MTTERKSKGMRVRVALIVMGIVAVVLACAAIWYVNDYYHADEAALAIMADEDGDADGVIVRALSDGKVAFVPDKPVAGLVFYPGGKVQPEAYAPLMQQCAERDILCVLVRPPFNLAFFDIDAASDAAAQFPDVKKWLIGGHSLGGVAACNYVADHLTDFDGIVLLAAYSAVDLTGFDGDVLALVGSNDEVLNHGAFEDARSNYEHGAQEEEIAGGNHAYFGNYGEQAGDGTATITREEQQSQTVDSIAALAMAA